MLKFPLKYLGSKPVQGFNSYYFDILFHLFISYLLKFPLMNHESKSDQGFNLYSISSIGSFISKEVSKFFYFFFFSSSLRFDQPIFVLEDCLIFFCELLLILLIIFVFIFYIVVVVITILLSDSFKSFIYILDFLYWVVNKVCIALYSFIIYFLVIILNET